MSGNGLSDTPCDLVTGGAGFIGSHLVDRLLAEGRKVRVADNMSTGHRGNLAHLEGEKNLEVIEGDVADPQFSRDACRGIDRVFHLAALADIVPSIQNPQAYFRSNVDGTFAMVEAAKNHAVRRFIYVASSTCYGIPDVYPTPETTPATPRYPYALTKYLGEQMVLHWARLYGLPAVSLRFFNVYGPRARTTGTYGAVFGVFLAQMLASEPLTIVGDGEQIRDFTFVTDAVDALFVAAESDKIGEVYNIGSGRPVSVNYLVELLGVDKTVRVPKRPGEPDCTWADTSKIESELGWYSRVSFEDGVRIMLDNIDYWKNAPVWTVDKIEEATADWFRLLSDDEQK